MLELEVNVGIVLSDLKLITPKRHGDHRGFFAETYSRQKYQEIGVGVEFVQDNHSISYSEGTVRGLHFQSPTKAQAKLVRCGRGAFFDVAVDIRKGSPTYGRWEGYELTANNGLQLYIPVGFAHGFLTTEPDSEIIYKCSDYYAPKMQGSVLWSDPDIGISWPLKREPTLSDNDTIAPLLKVLDSPFTYGLNS